MPERLKTIFVVNKILPDSDYRLAYGAHSKVCDIQYGLPEKPACLPDEKYVHLGFEEGLHWGMLRALHDLYGYLRHNRKELAFVHLFTTNPILFGSVIARLSRVPVVITLTGFGRVMTSKKPVYRLLRPVYEAFFRHALANARYVLIQNHANLAALTARFPGWSDKFIYVGSATDMPVRREKDFNSQVLRVFLGTRLLPDKGVGDFLAIARELRGQGFRFTLAGPYSRGFDTLLSEVRNAAANGYIDYLGDLDTPSLEDALTEAHILLFPSYGEGLARMMLEAGYALACPVAYDIPANRDLVARGRGFLVPTGDREGAIAVLRQLYTDRNTLAQNARAYQQHIVEHYSLAKFTQRLDDIFSNFEYIPLT